MLGRAASATQGHHLPLSLHLESEVPGCQREEVRAETLLCGHSALDLGFSARKKIKIKGTSLAIQGLRLHAAHEGGVGSIPGWETEVPYAMQHGQNVRK